METSSPLHDPISEFDERNNFLHFVLGLVSLSQGLIQQLDVEKPEISSLPETDDANDVTPDTSAELRDLLI